MMRSSRRVTPLLFLVFVGTTVAFLQQHRPSNSLHLHSSPADDEIAKLVEKRAQIKRKKREELDPTLPVEPIVDIDLDKLPEFKTERPVRDETTSSPTEDEDEEAAKKNKVFAIVDYRADYEDENDFHIPNRMGVSTKCWGDTSLNFVPSGKLTKRMIKAGKFVPGDIQLAYLKMMEGGVTLFETSPAYGSGSRSIELSAEQILRRCMQETGEGLPEVQIVTSLGQSPWTKILPSLTNGIVGSLEESLGRLGTPLLDLYQVPRSFFFPSALIANALAAAVESGQCNSVGVQAMSGGAVKRLKKKLEAKDVTLTSNCFDFSLTNRKKSKLIDACKVINVIPFISNPLDGGLASGIYTATNPSGGQQGVGVKFSFKELEKLQPLHSVQETVAERVQTRVRREIRDTQERYKSRYGPPPKINTDITTTQVALNYVIAKGGVPLVEVNTPRQAEEALGCLGWSLTDDEVAMLDAAADLCSL